MPVASVSDLELGRLFLGDKLSLGYYHVNPVVELCRRKNPTTFQRLCADLFGAIPVDDIDPRAVETAEEAYHYWELQGRPKVIANGD